MSADSLPKHLESFKRSLEEKERQEAAKESARIYQLSLWGDAQRGLPNEFVRSALFPAIAPNKARYMEQETIFSQGGFSVTYTGKQLSQSDLDVYEGVVHIARGTHEGNKIRFSAHELLKLIGRDSGKSQYKWLLGVLERLTATSVRITRDDRTAFWGSLLPKGSADLEDGKFAVEVNRDMIKLFSRGFTVISSSHRRALGKKPLAQALHLWINSHDKPFPVTVQYLHDMTGSTTKELKKYRQSLKAALDALKEVGVISDWHIDSSDKVHLVKAI